MDPQDFLRLVTVMRAIADSAVGRLEGDRYLNGYLFGLGVAEECGRFEPWPDSAPDIIYQDAFLAGIYDGRAGDASKLLLAVMR
jgi:hypothetical protein